ncbi:DNA polymerase delta subunit 3 like protein [Verticillium longisporum]|nr:DNA polymerase delta subunit 3 like protein [Verticillium longisporum]
MMEEYTKYLADRLFTEDKMVTYRTLSRALKVHVNTAKGMLYEFHKSQNATTPGKVHATYLVYGTKSAGVQEDGDHEMTSSPPEMDAMGDDVPTHTLTLVHEDRLTDVLAAYEEVTSFQVYSLAPFPNKEYQLLSDVTRELLQYSHEDPVAMASTPQAQPAPKPAEKKAPAATAAAPSPAPEVKEETKPAAARDMFAKKAGAGAAALAKAAPSLKRGGSSGIMSAFSKAAAKASKGGSKPSSNASTPKPVDSPALSDDGEDDEDPLPAPKRAAAEGGRKSRQDREAALRQMMEESEDEPEDEEDKDEEEGEAAADEPMEDVHEPALDRKTDMPARPSEEVVASTGDGRRRGKRRIMKKTQTVDKEGYFVTTQEEAWESFSEDEPAPRAPALAKVAAAPSSGTQPKAKKAAPKGQGNIMSFFSKK